MDAAKKTAIEQRIVIGLAGVFALTFCLGPLRSLGMFGRRAPADGATPPTDRVSVSQPLGVMMQQNWRRMDQEAEAQGASARLAKDEPGAPGYRAQQLRDPLESLIPRPMEQPSTQPTVQPATQSTARPTSPAEAGVAPPTLEVQGIVWGGAAPKAVIDDHVYGIHDVVKGGKILAIDRQGVTIEYQGQARVYSPASGRR